MHHVIPVLYKYRPRNVHALGVLLAHETKEEAKRCYMANMAWMTVLAISSFGGANLEIPSYSDVFGAEKHETKQKTAEEICDDIINGLMARGGAEDGGSI